jgi:hypothetical protein
MLDRMNLALCNNALAEVTIDNKVLQLAEEDWYSLCSNARWFTGHRNYMTWSHDFPLWCDSLEWVDWRPDAKAEFEKQGGMFALGIDLLITHWFVPDMMDLHDGASLVLPGLLGGWGLRRYTLWAVRKSR